MRHGQSPHGLERVRTQLDDRRTAGDAWEAEGGRGLRLVHSLTGGRWGTAPAVALLRNGPPHPDGKAVWFDLGAPGWA
ncbi:hypothetical protein [Streptomyces europaeiscabiei]|uniref:hypothetical protein n=1 Tax=Streptomyces europaeiscabiei TaxID=146819 RepID=UPI001968C343|nr:hypothetical protein [Streptomyces europaeiscabiei]